MPRHICFPLLLSLLTALAACGEDGNLCGELVEDESTAALLTTCFYIPFTITRTSGLFLARQFNSVQLSYQGKRRRR